MRRQRDMDLIRSLMLEFAGDASSGSASPSDAEKRKDHVRLLQDGGFLTKAPAPPSSGLAVFHTPQITWKGHDFLDSVRDPVIWAKTKDGALAAGGWTLSLLGDLAKGFARQQIAKRTGVEL